MITKATTASPMVALDSFVGRLGKEDVVIRLGEEFPADHPAVKKWPSKFGRADSGPRVETATAAPGEKRGA